MFCHKSQVHEARADSRAMEHVSSLERVAAVAKLLLDASIDESGLHSGQSAATVDGNVSHKPKIILSHIPRKLVLSSLLILGATLELQQ